MEVSNQYWAGLFDGEGCVSLQKYRSVVHGEKFVVGIRAVVVQKEPYILFLLEKLFGGKVARRPNGVHHWQCGNAKEVIRFLSSIKPYVIIKAVEVSIALELLSGIIKPRSTKVFKDKNGLKWIRGKPAIGLEEIERRRDLENKFIADRADSKQSVRN